jgi:hypothetical protein
MEQISLATYLVLIAPMCLVLFLSLFGSRKDWWRRS